MAQVTGVVQSVETKPVSGGRVAYNLVVGGERYGAGLYQPKCREGDYVTFEVDDSRGYKNVAPRTLRVSANKPAGVPDAAPASPPTAPYPVRANSAAFDARQDTISKQAALNSAIAYMNVLQSADALALPKSGTKAKISEAADALLTKYTQAFYHQSTGAEWKGPSLMSEPDSTEESDDGAMPPEDQPWE